MKATIPLRIFAALTFALPFSAVAGPLNSPDTESAIVEESDPWYRLAGLYQYFQVDYLGSANAVTYTIEIENQFSFDWFDVENRLILDLADYPAEIADIEGNPLFVNGAGSGIGDLLIGTFFAPKNQGTHFHLGIGPVIQAPTAGDENLGSGKWTMGPGLHLEYHKEKLSAGLFLWNSWSFAGDTNRKRVNQLTAKPYFIYQMTDTWSVLYIPLGISSSWDKPSNDRWKIPLGGGLGHKFNAFSREMEFQAQAFYTAVRPEKAPEWSIRFTLEMPF